MAATGLDPFAPGARLHESELLFRPGPLALGNVQRDLCAIERFLTHGATLEQAFGSVERLLGVVDPPIGRVERRAGLRDLLASEPALEFEEERARGCSVRLGLLETRLHLETIEVGKLITFLNRVALTHRDRLDASGGGESEPGFGGLDRTRSDEVVARSPVAKQNEPQCDGEQHNQRDWNETLGGGAGHGSISKLAANQAGLSRPVARARVTRAVRSPYRAPARFARTLRRSASALR